MAIEPRNLMTTSTRAEGPQMVADPDGDMVVDMYHVAAAPFYPNGMPVAYDTALGYYTAFEHGGANGRDVCRGFVYAETEEDDAADDGVKGHQVHATNETKCRIMFAGFIHVDYIQAVPSGSTAAQIKTAIADPTKRINSLKVQGLASVRY